MGCGLGPGLERVGGGGKTKGLGAVHNHRTTDPQHRRRADGRQEAQERRHPGHKATPHGTRGGKPRIAGHVKADVVHLHDQGHAAIDHDGDEDADNGQRDRLDPEGAFGDGAKGNRHDLC